MEHRFDYAENQILVERYLSQLRLFDKLCSNEEWETIMYLSHFLQVFKTASEILSGEKFTTVSLVLLFRTEIQHALAIKPNDCTVVKELKEDMQLALDHRIPVTELYVVAAILDPSQCNLSTVQEFLSARDLTAVDLLTEFLGRYVTDDGELGQDTTGNGLSAHEEPSNKGKVPWKKAKLKQLTKQFQSKQSIKGNPAIQMHSGDSYGWIHSCHCSGGKRKPTPIIAYLV